MSDHPKFDAFRDERLKNPEVRAGYEAAKAEHEEAACDWSDFRKDFGVSPDDKIRRLEHRAFLAGWKAGRRGEQAGVQR